MKFIGALILLTLTATSSMANESTCGRTTHGMPLRDKLLTVDIRDANAVLKGLGPAQLTKTVNGKGYVIWYDILHEASGTPANGSLEDCGVMIALISEGANTTSVMKSLQSVDIDLLLAGKVPEIGGKKIE